MANVMFKKGLLANLPSTYAEGTFYVATDERSLWLDISDSQRIRFGDFQEFATLDALKANTNPSTTALYYIADMNCLAKWNGSDYIQINLDTGATSFDIEGEGNVIVGIKGYDATTRKVTFTMGTMATPDDVDAAIEAKVGNLTYNETEYDTVKAYVDAKTAGIATDAALSDLQANVSQAESDIDALQAQVGEGTVSDQIDAKITALDLENAYEAKGEAAKVQTALDEYKESNDAAVKENSDAIAAINDEADGVLAQAKAYADGKDEAIAAAKQSGDDAKDAVDALAAKVGEVPEDKTVVQMIADAQSAATYDDTDLAARVTDNEEAIALLNDGAEIEGSIDYRIAQAVAAIMENPDETMNSINELVTWVNDHAEDALELSNQVSANKDDIAALKELTGDENVETQISDAIADALQIDGIDKYALATDLTAAIARVAALEAKAHEHDNKDVLDGIDAEKVSAWDSAADKVHEHTNSDELDKIADGDVEKWNAAQANAEATAAAALAEAKAELEGKITAENERAVAAEAQALTDAKAYADGLAGNYDAAGSAAAAEANAKEYADGLVLAWGSF